MAEDISLSTALLRAFLADAGLPPPEDLRELRITPDRITVLSYVTDEQTGRHQVIGNDIAYWMTERSVVWINLGATARDLITAAVEKAVENQFLNADKVTDIDEHAFAEGIVAYLEGKGLL